MTKKKIIASTKQEPFMKPGPDPIRTARLREQWAALNEDNAPRRRTKTFNLTVDQWPSR